MMIVTFSMMACIPVIFAIIARAKNQQPFKPTEIGILSIAAMSLFGIIVFAFV